MAKQNYSLSLGWGRLWSRLYASPLVGRRPNMERAAMERLGQWILDEIDKAVGLYTPVAEFKAPKICVYTNMEAYCEECAHGFLAIIKRRIISCGRLCGDASVVTSDSAEILLRSAIESVITARYIMNGSTVEEKIKRMLSEEYGSWMSSTRADEEMLRWISENEDQELANIPIFSDPQIIVDRIQIQKSIKDRFMFHHTQHFSSEIQRLSVDQKSKDDDHYFRIGYYLYRDTSAAVHGESGTRALVEDASLLGCFSWIVRAIAQTLGEYRVLLGMESRGAELWREAMSLADQWSATE